MGKSQTNGAALPTVKTPARLIGKTSQLATTSTSGSAARKNADSTSSPAYRRR